MKMNYRDLAMKARTKSLKLTLKQQQEIVDIYTDVIDELAEKAENYGEDKLTYRWLEDYTMQIFKARSRLMDNLNGSIRDSIKQAGKNAIEPDLELFKQAQRKAGIDLGDHFTEMFSQAPNEALGVIIKGDLYRDGKGLSERIWNHTNEFGQDIDYIIKRAMAEKKSALELAKDLEHFVKPEHKRPWSWGKVYPNLRTKQIDYNAQRLARTSITHAHRESQYRSAARNPFVEAIHWELSPEHFTRQVSKWGEDECDEYTNQNWYNLGKGNFPIEEVPLSHPQCLCFTYPVIPKSLDEIADELKAWVEGMNPELNEWFGSWFKAEIKSTKETKLDDLVSKVTKMKDATKNSLRKTANQILDDVGLEHVKFGIRQQKWSYGFTSYYVGHNNIMDVKELVLNSKERRGLHYQKKTFFHELFHAKAHGLKTHAATDKKAYTMIEETFAETSAQYICKKLGFEDEIAASYADKLVEMLPRLKKLDKFKDCKTFADFGKIAWEDRLNKVNPEWIPLYNKTMEIKHDWEKYVDDNYIDYIQDNLDELLDKMLENMPEYKKYKSNMMTDFKNAKKSIEDNKTMTSNEKMVLQNLASIAMNRLGVK